jgi:uncharacterized membrane protein YeaQ/YmgE (transglycosylase-associated protein family)
MQLLVWVAEGVAAVWLMSLIMLSKGRDQMMDILMGLTGGVAGGFLLSVAHLLVRGAMIYTSLAAVSGAVALTELSRYASGRQEYARGIN